MIDTSNWKKFNCNILFECKNTGNVLARDITDGSGNTPYVTSSCYNNGVVAYIDASNYEIIEGHCILVGGKTFTITYQKKNFVSNDSHNFVIRVKDYNISEFSYLFLTSLIYRYFGQKYSWNDAVTKDRLLQEKLPLPATSNGLPDWAYMESYMKQIMKESEKSLENLKKADGEKHSIDTRNWGSFRIGDLFDVVKGTRLTKANMKEGNIRFVGSSAMNNGETARIANDENLHPANTITVCYNGSVGETFYQDEQFWASDDVNVLYPLFTMNSYIAFFICPIIKSVGQKYAFIDKWKQKTMKEDFIKLPITSKGKPDWRYMEDYMKNTMDNAEDTISALQSGLRG